MDLDKFHTAHKYPTLSFSVPTLFYLTLLVIISITEVKGCKNRISYAPPIYKRYR